MRSILSKIGESEEALACGAQAPIHEPSARALREAGEAPGRIHNNCSGKHAGMLELEDNPDLKSGAFGRGGSSPPPGTRRLGRAVKGGGLHRPRRFFAQYVSV